jgi:NAD(P)H-flavin reductase
MGALAQVVREGQCAVAENVGNAPMLGILKEIRKEQLGALTHFQTKIENYVEQRLAEKTE